MKTNIEVRYAAHPDDVRHWDTDRLRREHLVSAVFQDNAVTMVYSLYDRMVAGGAKPAGEALKLEPVDEVKAAFFLHRRELGVFNVGGPGRVTAGGAEYALEYRRHCTWAAVGDREVTFESSDAAILPSSISIPHLHTATTLSATAQKRIASPQRWDPPKQPTTGSSKRVYYEKCSKHASCRWV